MGEHRGGEQRARRALLTAAFCLLVAGCSGGSTTSPAGAASPTQPCVCNCAGGAKGAVDLGDLSESASRKMMHDDGEGCMADLARIEQIDSGYARRLVVLRAQCEMLTGRCQAGKQRAASWYRDQTNMSPERATAMSEALGSMHCRGGDSTPRDELQHALYDLTQAAYVDTRDPAFCRERLSTVQRTAPQVPSRGPDDTQINNLNRTLYHTAASCFARAGDCPGAWAVFRANYPSEALSSMKDPMTRETILKSSFESLISRCKGKI